MRVLRVGCLLLAALLLSGCSPSSYDVSYEVEVAKSVYLEGAPELIVEVAASSASYDLHEKLNVYQRNGVQEYLVWQIYEHRLDWFVLEGGKYVALQPDADGIIHSRIFPGWARSCSGPS